MSEKHIIVKPTKIKIGCSMLEVHDSFVSMLYIKNWYKPWGDACLWQVTIWHHQLPMANNLEVGGFCAMNGDLYYLQLLINLLFVSTLILSPEVK